MASQRDGGIAWCDETWNPVRGCSRVSKGCMNCYAESVAARFSGPGLPYEGLATMKDGKPHWTGKVELVEKHLADPLRWKKPRRIFVNSMSDLFHESLPDKSIDQVFAVMALAPQHTFQILTKRPERMRAYFSDGLTSNRVGHAISHAYHRSKRGVFPGWLFMPKGAEWAALPNVWLGVSVEDQETADERIPLLLETPAVCRFVSYEPALQAVRFCKGCPGCLNDCAWCPTPNGRGLHWVIVGGESGHGARHFDIAWARSTIQQCRAAGVACFVKQLGSTPIEHFEAVTIGDCHVPAETHTGWLLNRKGGDWSEWPADLRVREFPIPKGA